MSRQRLAPPRRSPAPAPRGTAGFTILELLVAMTITIVLLAIASDVLSNMHRVISIGAANGEIVNTAAALETRLRNDFRNISPEGFMVVKWSDELLPTQITPIISGGLVKGATVNFPNGNLVSYPCVVINNPGNSFTILGNYTNVFSPGFTFTVSGSAVNNGIYTVSSSSYSLAGGGAIPPNSTTILVPTSVTGTVADGYLLPYSVVIFDPGTISPPAPGGTGAVAQLTMNPNGGGLVSIGVPPPYPTNNGTGYTQNTRMFVIGPPADQISFFANGPTTTTRYNVVDQTAGTGDTNGARTFQSQVARIWYGHLASNRQFACVGASHGSNKFYILGNYTSIFAPGVSFTVAGATAVPANNGSYAVASSSYPDSTFTNCTSITTNPAVPSDDVPGDGALEISNPAYTIDADENGNYLAPQYWRLGRQAVLLSDDAARYDATTVPSSNGIPAILLPTIIASAGPASISGFTVISGGSGYSGTPAITIPPPLPQIPSEQQASATATVNGSGAISGVNTFTNNGAGYVPFLATQSIWQANDTIAVNSGVNAYLAYGIMPGLSDIVSGSGSDLSSIRSLILTTNDAAPTGASATGTATWPVSPYPSGATGTFALRMAAACMRPYGTPYATPTNLTAESSMYSQPVLEATCSTFKVELSNDGTFTDIPRPGGALLEVKNVDPITHGITGVIVVPGAAGHNYDTNAIIDASTSVYRTTGGPPTGTGAVIQITGVNAYGAITSVGIVNVFGGSNYAVGDIFCPTGVYAAGYSQVGGTSGCKAWPAMVRITTTLQDQKGTMHNLATVNNSGVDGRLFTYVLQVPQP